MPAPKGNKYAIGNKGGRPPVFKNPKHLSKKVDEYFDYILGEFHIVGKKKVFDREPEPATIMGLVLYLGFNGRQSLDDYAEKNEEYSDVIKRARARVQYEYEKRLSEPKPTGSIFALKNMGWSDNRGIELTGDPDKPVEVRTQTNVDYNKLSNEVLEAIAKARKPSNE
jgi:hypothetical protein